MHKNAKLTDQEYEIIKRHPVDGAEMLKYIEHAGDPIVHDMTLYHHERFCGGGYPYNFSGDDIPLAGRMGLLVDVFEALSAKRSYKGELTFGNIDTC